MNNGRTQAASPAAPDAPDIPPAPEQAPAYERILAVASSLWKQTTESITFPETATLLRWLRFAAVAGAAALGLVAAVAVLGAIRSLVQLLFEKPALGSLGCGCGRRGLVQVLARRWRDGAEGSGGERFRSACDRARRAARR